MHADINRLLTLLTQHKTGLVDVGDIHRNIHLEEAAGPRVLVNVDHKGAGRCALYSPVLDINSATQHGGHLQHSRTLRHL